jgi:hypothetical protein
MTHTSVVGVFRTSSYRHGIGNNHEGKTELENNSYVVYILIKYLQISWEIGWWCTVKKGNDFPVPSRDVTYQTLPGRE